MKARSIWGAAVFAVGVFAVMQSACSTAECARDADCEATLGAEYECRVVASTCVKRGEDGGISNDSGVQKDGGLDTGTGIDAGNDAGVEQICVPGCNLGQRCLNGACVCDEVSCPNGCCNANSCARRSDCGTCANTCQWSQTGPLITAHNSGYTTTLLPSGTVLVLGGRDINASPIDSAELYDPASNSWRSATQMPAPRWAHAAALLPSGRVLVCGGFDSSSGSRLASCVRYDPEHDLWSTSASMNFPRFGHSLVRLQSGAILAVGGVESASESAEIYDPETNSWVKTIALQANRSNAGRAHLGTDRVLLVGGDGSNGTAEVLDAKSATSVPTIAPPYASSNASVVPLEGGKILVAGGNFRADAWKPPLPLNKTALFDLQTAQWTEVGPLATPRSEPSAVLLTSGRVLVVQGNTAEIFDPSTNTWVDGGTLSAQHIPAVAIRLSNGNILVVGGDTAPEIFR